MIKHKEIIEKYKKITIFNLNHSLLILFIHFHFHIFFPSNLHIQRLIIPNRRHYVTHKLQKHNKTLIRLNTFPLGPGLINKPFQHIRMFTRMNSQHPKIQIRHGLFSNSLIMILLINIFKHLFRRQWSTINTISLYPQSRCMIILVVGNVYLIVSEILFALL